MVDEPNVCPACGAEPIDDIAAMRAGEWTCGSYPLNGGGIASTDVCRIRQQAAAIERLTGLLLEHPPFRQEEIFRKTRDEWLEKLAAALAAAALEKEREHARLR